MGECRSLDLLSQKDERNEVLSIVSALSLVLRLEAWPALLRMATTQALLCERIELLLTIFQANYCAPTMRRA